MKSEITILQEFAAKNKLAVPLYQFENKTSYLGPKFNCHCHFVGKSALGMSTNKKEAKQDAAKNMLELLSISHFEPNGPPLISTPVKTNFNNPIGRLNEYLVKNGYAYATYKESETVNGLFMIRCHHLHYVTEGTGPNKKTAKFNAAVQMLKSLNVWKTSADGSGQLIEVDTSAKVSPFAFVTEKDHVSSLDEFCMKNQIPPPIYFENEMKNDVFTVKIVCKSHEALGKGYNKRLAKQNAADRMLQLLEAMTNSRVEKESIPETEMLEFCSTNVHKESLKKSPPTEVEVQNESRTTLTNVEKLKILQERNVNFQFKELRKDPYAYSLSFTSTQIPTVIIHDDKEKVMDKLLSTALENLKIK